MSDDYLMHHGRKGMKWGQHIFGKERKVNGTLSSREMELLKPYVKPDKRQQRHRVKAGIAESGNDLTIERGTTFNRYTSHPNETMNRRKYASITKHDEREYRGNAKRGLLWAREQGIYQMQMSAVEKMKVARGKDVVDSIVANSKSKKLQSDWASVRELDSTPSETFTQKRLKSREFKDAAAHYEEARTRVWRYVGDTMKNEKASSKLINDYAKKGYQAIEDPEDMVFYSGYDSSMILLRPNKSVKVKSVKKIA